MINFILLLECVFSIYIILLFGTQTKKDNWLLARIYDRVYPNMTFQQVRRSLFKVTLISAFAYVIVTYLVFCGFF